MLTMMTNASKYAWGDWMIGILRSFLSGGAAALVTGGGGAIAGITAKQQYIMMGSSFLGLGLYRMGEFLQLHGAPDQLQASLTTAASATAEAGKAIADAQAQAPAVTPKP